MSRRLNFTGRQRLMRESVRIRMHDGQGGRVASFSAALSIPAEMALPPESKIYVEAYVGVSAMRFDFGTVALPLAPDTCDLTDIDVGTPVLFRVKIVDEATHVGRILAAANGIRPEGEDEGKDRKPLLPLRSSDLGEEVWLLQIDKDGGPMLVVNSRIPGLADRIPGDGLLTAVLYPEIVRQLTRYVWAAEQEFDEDAEWVGDWKAWLTEQYGREITDDDVSDVDTIDMLGNDIAKAFAAKHRFATNIIRLLRRINHDGAARVE